MTDWIEAWLSAPRFAVYLTDAGGDRALALARYDWNARMAAALHHDLGHLEVGLRNAYDRALRHRDRPATQHWVYNPERHFPVRIRTPKGGKPYDSNGKTRENIEKAIAEIARTSGNPHPDPGKVIAELNFGFWRYLTVNRLDELWRTHLHRAFVRGTNRHFVDRRITRLHELRNRVAHHEPLLQTPLAARHTDILDVAARITPELRDHIAARSQALTVLAERP